MARLKALLIWFRNIVIWFWDIARRPSTHLSLGFLALGGFVFGVLFWGAFNTALELTNTEKFCTGCHEMHDNVYQELQRTIHFSNRSGVRATCPACHVPHEWTDKIARKMQASKEVFGKIFGTISTRQKFLEHRLVLAKHEWARMKSNDSLECRNCHSAIAMDFTKQTQRAADIHSRYLITKERTCIDCHKGIAHELPDMTGIEPGWRAPPKLRDTQSSSEDPSESLARYLASPAGGGVESTVTLGDEVHTLQ